MIIVRDTEAELDEEIRENGYKVLWRHIYSDSCVAEVECIKKEKKAVTKAQPKSWGIMRYIGSSIAYIGNNSKSTFFACNAKLMTKGEAESRCLVLNRKYRKKVWDIIKLN